MVKDNGRDPRDPEYDDYGYSDFVSDYQPDNDQLVELFQEHPEKVLKFLLEYHETTAVFDLHTLWKDLHEDDIEAEWEARSEPEQEPYDVAGDR